MLKEYKRREKEFLERAVELERVIGERDAAKQEYDALSKKRLDEFMTGFQIISMRLKELYQVGVPVAGYRLALLLHAEESFPSSSRRTAHHPRRKCRIGASGQLGECGLSRAPCRGSSEDDT